MGKQDDTQLRGKKLDGSVQKDAVENVDTELHLDDEPDSLYNDGMDLDDDTETLADTHGNVKRG